MAATAERPKGKQAWFCTTGLPSDIIIQVDDMNFHLHKFPLMSKSRKLHEMITEQEARTTMPSATRRQSQEEQHEIEEEEEEEEDAEDDGLCQISLTDFLGGSGTFEMAAKFCYGVKINLSSSNVVPLRCAAEFLEMTEEYSADNLISKTERFLSQSVFKSPKESLKALKSCEPVLPLAENLGIVQRCIDSVASRASSADPMPFGWPVKDGTNEIRGSSRQPPCNEVENGVQRTNLGRGRNAESCKFEDLAQLSLAMFKRLILAMKTRDVNPNIIESCLMHYAKKYIHGISRSSRKPSSAASVASEQEQRELLETIIANLPLEKRSRSSISTRFLFGLLRTANIINASESCKAALEKKIGSQLEQATLDDLLIPSYSYLNETLYDVDCVERILSHFLDGLEERNATGIEAEAGDDSNSLGSAALMLVGKLIDGYLSEIASDANLKPEKFYNLAISLPDQARVYDDGLYRAIDVYLKAHPWLPESESEKICGIIDYQKFTLEACTHAAQNERLPLRTVVQVLFLEQLQLRCAITGTLLAAETTQTEAGRLSVMRREDGEGEEGEGPALGAVGQRSTWRTAVRENQVLRVDMDGMRTRVHQLERECSMMRKVIEKFEKGGTQGGGWRGSLNKRFGCKFETQVCDSQEPIVAEARKGRHHQH
ncbi:hypothetical protein SLE2022_361700 [Rubroshorea leprosula]